MKKVLIALCALLLMPTLATANSDMVSISELRQQVEAMGQWTQNDTVNGKIIEINAPIKVPDVDELPVIIVSRLESDDEGLKQKISDGGELSYKDLSGMSIGKIDEQSIYNINIQQCRTRSYLCINDFWNYERENDVAQMYANDNAYSLADVKEKIHRLYSKKKEQSTTKSETGAILRSE